MQPAPAPSFAEAAGLDFNSAAVTSRPSECDQRLAGIAAATLLPRLIGPGACGGEDMVELTAVILPDNSRVEVKPAAVLRCPMAAAFSAWLREEVAPRMAKLGSALRAVENYDSYECRGRNRVFGAKLSEHGKGNAIDVRAFHLTDGRRVAPAEATVDKELRTALRASACERFATVLGPHSDGFHETHIHLDLAARRSGMSMCQWAVLAPPPPTTVAAVAPVAGADMRVPLPKPRPPGRAVKHVRNCEARLLCPDTVRR